MTRVVKKKAGFWPIFRFCNFLDRMSSFEYVQKKFCNKNLFDLFHMVSDSFPRCHTACRISIKLVMINGKHGEREQEVQEELLPISGFGSRQRILYRDRVFPASVTIEGFLLRHVWPRQGVFGSQQRLAHNLGPLSR